MSVSIAFNAREVYEMAIRIEENGARFYQTAATLFSDRGKIEGVIKEEKSPMTLFLDRIEQYGGV